MSIPEIDSHPHDRSIFTVPSVRCFENFMNIETYKVDFSLVPYFITQEGKMSKYLFLLAFRAGRTFWWKTKRIVFTSNLKAPKIGWEILGRVGNIESNNSKFLFDFSVNGWLRNKIRAAESGQDGKLKFHPPEYGVTFWTWKIYGCFRREKIIDLFFTKTHKILVQKLVF